MKPKTHCRGALLIEILVALLLTLVLGAALAALLKTTFTVSSFSTGQNNVDAQAREELDTLADQLRNAQSFTNGAVKQVFSAALASDLTVYRNSTGDTARFWLDSSVTPPALKKSQTTSGVTTTTIVLSGVNTLQFTYYQQAQATYTAASGSWTTTTSSHAPTAAELSKVGAVGILISVTNSGYSNQLSSLVRLRNSPY